MADDFDRASELEAREREAAIRRQLAQSRIPMQPAYCAFCEENKRLPLSLYCARCELEGVE